MREEGRGKKDGNLESRSLVALKVSLSVSL